MKKIDLIQIGILITMVVTISHLILEIYEIRRKKKIDTNRLKQSQEILELEKTKTGMATLKQILDMFGIPKIIEVDFDKPEEVKKQLKKIVEFGEKMKEMSKKEEF